MTTLERGRRLEREVSMTEPDEPPHKLSRQQLRAQARQKHDAAGWIAALDIEDLQLQRAIQAAIGQRQVTRADLEATMGVSLVGTPRTIRGMRKASWHPGRLARLVGRSERFRRAAGDGRGHRAPAGATG
jgi:hypothetical protein